MHMELQFIPVEGDVRITNAFLSIPVLSILPKEQDRCGCFRPNSVHFRIETSSLNYFGEGKDCRKVPSSYCLSLLDNPSCEAEHHNSGVEMSTV